MTADELLWTKLHIPAARANLVARPRLLAPLSEGLRLGRRLTLVSAPPGFGKTTLIREWALATGRPVAWLSLDEGDGDPGRFLRYVAAALEQAGAPGLQDAALESQAALVTLINRLAASGEEVLLVLDDYHQVRAFAVHDLVGYLLANQPPGLHVAIGTREDPPLPLARLRARDQVTEVRERALRFTPEEAGAFLNETMGLGLSPASVAALAARTEGWVTALQLAGLALRQQSSAEEFVAAFAGDDRYIVDYLLTEALGREPEPVRAFLRQTSILDRLSAPLCDALTGRGDSHAVLEHLEAANLFLVALDNRREWYRYHVLFGDVLRLSLTPQERVAVHKKAAAWFEGHGLRELALQHTSRAAELLAPPARECGTRQPLVEPLSAREIEVLQLIAEGYSNAEIGGKLYITTGTVKRHVNNIYGKLGAGSRTQAVARARALDLLK